MLAEAAELGVLQLHLSGGEPLQRHDIVELVQCANQLGMYTNLITSGLGFSTRRAEQLRDAGLDHVQVSIQADEQALSDRIAGTASFERKLVVARLVKQLGWPLTLNVVLHRQNIDRIGGILDMADDLEADRIELANTQYYGWAGPNRAELLPSRDQLERAQSVVRATRERLGDRMEIIYVIPDYYSKYPKPCMDGWARRQFTVAPNGEALPCPVAHDLVRGLELPRANVREHALEWIWAESPLFKRFRGDEWMPDPCRSCERRGIDFGGCRCQAFALTGDAARTDPVCHLSADHGLVAAAVAAANDPTRPPGAPIPRPQPDRWRSRWGYERELALRPDPDRIRAQPGQLPVVHRAGDDEAAMAPDRPGCPRLQRVRCPGSVDRCLGRQRLGGFIGPVADYAGAAALGAYALYLVVHAMRTEEAGDLDHPLAILGMPLPLSLDNLFAGASLGVVGASAVTVAVVCGCATLIMSAVGLTLGRLAASKVRIRTDLFGGLVLLGMAVLMVVRA